MNLQTNTDLTSANSMALVSRCDLFAELTTEQDVIDLVAIARQRELPISIIGQGSNLLFPEYVEGIVARWRASMEVEVVSETDDDTIVAVAAGYDWHQWVLTSIQYGHGLENLALIPGTVGACPVQNIGAYGVEAGDAIEWVEGVQISTGEIRRLSRCECQFGYRDSIFKHSLQQDFVISRVAFRLARDFQPNLSYGPLQDLDQPKPEQLIERVCQIRSEKLPLPAEQANVGSFFKNPVIYQELLDQLKRDFPELPSYPQANQSIVKIAAGWLIEQCGWKGKRVGNVGMHDRQALVMTADQAKLKEVLSLQKQIEDSVLEKFGVQLEREPSLLTPSRLGSITV